MLLESKAQREAILVFRTAALGDFILATPALAKIREQFPDQQIILLTTTGASAAQRLQAQSYTGKSTSFPWTALATPHLLDKVYVVPELNSFRGMLHARRLLAEYNFSIVVVMLEVGSPLMGRLKKWFMLKVVAGWVPVLGWRGPGSWNGGRAKLHRQGVLRHHVHGPLQFLAEMKPPQTYRDEDLRTDLRPDAAVLAWAASWITENAVNRKVVAIAPGSIQIHKRWPIEKFQKLCQVLAELHPELLFIVIGTPADAALGEALSASLDERVISLAGVTTIAQSAALLAHCCLLVGNDGGAMHLGDAMGIHVVSIVPGIEYPNSIEPWHNQQWAVRHPVECAPCYNFVACPLGHNRCMTDLPVDAVLERCTTLLALLPMKV